MFGLFSDQKSKLEKKYQKLLKEAYELSHSNRRLSDLKTAEAEQLKAQLETLEGKPRQ